MNRITRRTVIKRMALSVAAKERPHVGFTRVSKSFIEMVEAAARAAIISRVRQHPSRGKTLN